MEGLHLTADLHGCQCAPELMTKADAIATLCRTQTQAAGLTLVDDQWVKFPDWQGQPGGVTGMVLLAESHLAIHTWPETGNVTLDVYVCNFSGDNSPKAQQLLDSVVAAYEARRVVRKQLQRGDIGKAAAADDGEPSGVQAGIRQGEGEDAEGELAQPPFASGGSPSACAADPSAAPLPLDWPQADGWVTESLTPDAAFSYRARPLARQQTEHQSLEVLDTPSFGRVLRLDGRFMTSEKEEFFYHEALVHPAAVAHPEPKRCLIIGGGDGGAAEELLKHPGVQAVVVAELDAQVIAVARRELLAVHRGAFDDPRVRVVVGDGMAFIDQSPAQFDLLLMDLTDPDTPASALYERAALQRMKAALAPGGALVLHLGSPVFHPERVRRLLHDLNEVFAHVSPYGLYIPLYGAHWGLAVASDSLQPRQLSRAQAQAQLAARGLAGLQYYNAEVHGALFALPNYYRQLLPNASGTEGREGVGDSPHGKAGIQTC